MKTKKTDLRSKYTQNIVKQALLNLLREQPLNKIAVSALCSAAAINRGTFYNHFYDVYDVYETIESELNGELKAKIESQQFDNLNKSFFKEIMLLLYRNIDLVRVILINREKNGFLQNILTYVKDKFIKEWTDSRKTLRQSYAEQIFSYAAGGAIAIITDWMQADMPQSIDEIAELIENLNNLLIEFILRKE